jgi:hypothetical protein
LLEKLEEKEISTRVELDQLAPALASVQAELAIVEITGDFERDYIEIERATRPSLTKNGFCVLYQIENYECGNCWVDDLHMFLLHRSGQYLKMTFELGHLDYDRSSSSLHRFQIQGYQLLIGVVTYAMDKE